MNRAGDDAERSDGEERRMNLAAPRARLVIVDGVPMSALVAEPDQPEDPKAVIVAIHGGGTTAIYSTARATPRLPCSGPARRADSPWWPWTGPATVARLRTPRR